TFVNVRPAAEPLPIRLGDGIALGRGGPVLLVEGLGTSPAMPVARAPARPGQRTLKGLISQAIAQAREERRRGKRGSTGFLRAVAAEVGRDSRRKLRWLSGVAMVLVVLLGGAVYGVYWLLSSQVQQTEAARRTAEDSARAETQRLRQELAAARAAAAPATQVERLRTQLRAADPRERLRHARTARPGRGGSDHGELRARLLQRHRLRHHGRRLHAHELARRGRLAALPRRHHLGHHGRSVPGPLRRCGRHLPG